MTQAVDVPLLSTFGFAYPLLLAAASLFKGLLVGAVVTFVLVKVLGRSGVAARWPVALATGGALFLAVTAWSWLSSSDYTAIRVTADAVELRYATWPRPGRRIPFDQIASVSMSSSGRRGRSHHLVITTKPASALERTHLESAAGSEEHITLAIQWIEHASGGRVARPAR